jgi:PIN domain nuclease of toxin-antitoxin system
MLAARKRVTVAGDVLPWFQSLVTLPGARLAPLDNEVLIRSTTLPGEFHKDPADRMIVATARKLSVPLISADAWIRAYPLVQSIW